MQGFFNNTHWRLLVYYLGLLLQSGFFLQKVFGVGFIQFWPQTCPALFPCARVYLSSGSSRTGFLIRGVLEIIAYVCTQPLLVCLYICTCSQEQPWSSWFFLCWQRLFCLAWGFAFKEGNDYLCAFPATLRLRGSLLMLFVGQGLSKHF